MSNIEKVQDVGANVSQDYERSPISPGSSRHSNDETTIRTDLIKNLLTKVDKDFNDICLDDDKLKKAAESYLNRVIDFLTLGVAFSVYREIKMGSYSTSVIRIGQPPPEDKTKIRSDIFAEYHDQDRKCVCSKCTKMVLASGFAMHLEVCMGIKQSRTRNSRRVVTATSSRERDSPSYESLPSSDEDNDDDADWSCGGEKRKKKRDKNTNKRIKGAKKTEVDSNELIEIDVEGENDRVIFDDEEADDIFSLSEFFGDDSLQSFVTASCRSNGSSDEQVATLSS